MKEIITIMIIIAVSQGLFLGMVLLFRKKDSQTERILGLLFIAISLGMVMNYFRITENPVAFYYAVYVNISFYLLYGPFIYLFTLSITGRVVKFTARHLFHFVPFVLFLSYMVIRYRFLEWTGVYDVSPFNDNRPLVSFPNMVAFFLFIILAYITRSLYLVRRYKQRLKNFFSDVEKLRLLWLSFLLSGASLFVLLLLILLFWFRDLRVNYLESGIALVIFMVYVAAIYISTFFTIRYPEIFSRVQVHELTESGDNTPKYEKLRLDDDTRLQYREDLLRYMKEHQPYLKDSLTLRDLADLVNIPHHHLSIIINTGLNRNFYMFINNYRIEEAKKLLSDPRYNDINILNIAYSSGFNSKTTFNTVFKQVTGLTPTEFRKKNTTHV